MKTYRVEKIISLRGYPNRKYHADIKAKSKAEALKKAVQKGVNWRYIDNWDRAKTTETIYNVLGDGEE